MQYRAGEIYDELSALNIDGTENLQNLWLIRFCSNSAGARSAGTNTRKNSLCLMRIIDVSPATLLSFLKVQMS